MARNPVKYFIETHPETLPFLRFLTTYREEWTTVDLARDYPGYHEEHISKIITKLRDANVIAKIRYVRVKPSGDTRPLWKLTGEARTHLDQ